MAGGALSAALPSQAAPQGVAGGTAAAILALPPEAPTGVQAVVTTIIIPAFQAIRAGAQVVADAVNAIFGTDLSAGQVLIAATLLSGVLCAAVAGGVYKVALTNVTNEKRTENYWGKKYDVFYRKNDDQARVDWMLGKYADMAALVGLRRNLWHDYGHMSERLAIELGAVDRWLWVGLDVAGLIALWRARERRPGRRRAGRQPGRHLSRAAAARGVRDGRGGDPAWCLGPGPGCGHGPLGASARSPRAPGCRLTAGW